MSSITWYGHSAFRIRSEGVSILVDPFIRDASLARRVEEDGVDLALVTHDHADHVGDVVGICQRTGAKLGAIVGTAGSLVERGVPQEQVIGGGFNMGGTIMVKGAKVTMTQAYHSSETGSPAGYIVRMPDGLTVYHAGDTCIFSGMALWGKLYHIDVALLPMGGFYTMDAQQAAMACALLKCDAVIPMHWGTFPLLAQGDEEFTALVPRVAPNCKVVNMKIGETVSFDR